MFQSNIKSEIFTHPIPPHVAMYLCTVHGEIVKEIRSATNNVDTATQQKNLSK